MKMIISVVLSVVMMLGCLSGCGNKEQVIIYTSTNDDVIAHMTEALNAEFPQYDIVIEYLSTSKHAARLMAEGTATQADIIHDLAYENMAQLEEAGILAELSGYDTSIYTPDAVVSTKYLPEIRCGGAILVNTKVLADRNLPEPKSYEDLLKPEYKGLICMPDPKASRSGYAFIKGLANVWGDEEAVDYFVNLRENILQFTSGSSGVTNALVQQEVAIGLSLITHTVSAINEGAPLKVIVPEEGAPYSMYGQAIIKGKETRESVKAVFDYIINEYNAEHCRVFYPEKIYQNEDFVVENYPQNIKYADMKNDTLAEKERLLEMWTQKTNG